MKADSPPAPRPGSSHQNHVHFTFVTSHEPTTGIHTYLLMAFTTHFYYTYIFCELRVTMSEFGFQTVFKKCISELASNITVEKSTPDKPATRCCTGVLEVAHRIQGQRFHCDVSERTYRMHEMCVSQCVHVAKCHKALPLPQVIGRSF